MAEPRPIESAAARPTVAVIGAGFSGLLTALHLLSAPDGPQVRLIERRGTFGRGRAYATDNPEHLLNVRVANMSAFPDQPDHFVQWLSQRDGWRATGAFVTRGVYGDYLQSLLARAVQGAYGVDRLLLELDEAVDIRPVGARWEIETAMGRTLAVDAVVLALGSPPPSPPHGAAPDVLASPRYIGDPWRPDGEAELGRHVLLLGTGLTMVDAAFALSRGYRRFTAISRRGLVPQSHDVRAPSAERADLAGSPAGVLCAVRGLARDRDWREVVDEARGATRGVWRSWSLAERRRFLRHLRPWWEAHRHRMAPAVARRVQEMRKSGELVIRAGVIERLDLAQDEVRVEWRARGTHKLQTFAVDAVVNCTGPGAEAAMADQRLVASLLARGLGRADACRLGLDVDEEARLVGADGVATRRLYAVGPLTRGAFWEITAVPDIRGQAAAVAAALLAELRLTVQPGCAAGTATARP